MHSPIRARWRKFRRGVIRNGPSRRSSSRARRPASTSAASSRAASRPPSTPASRTGAPASVRSAPASRVRRSPASSRRSRHSPSMVANRVERGRYLDSVALMRIARRVAALGGVEAGALMIGTPSNKALLREAGLLAADGERAEPNDLIIARLGGGVSHGIGVGGRDLDERVGALGMLAALDMLDADPGTRTLVLISKPPAPAVAQRVLARIRQSTKRSVVCFLGESGGTLTDAAEAAMERRPAYLPPRLPQPS